MSAEALRRRTPHRFSNRFLAQARAGPGKFETKPMSGRESVQDNAEVKELVGKLLHADSKETSRFCRKKHRDQKASVGRDLGGLGGRGGQGEGGRPERHGVLSRSSDTRTGTQGSQMSHFRPKALRGSISEFQRYQALSGAGGGAKDPCGRPNSPNSPSSGYSGLLKIQLDTDSRTQNHYQYDGAISPSYCECKRTLMLDFQIITSIMAP